ncbi:hypothetical protein [Mesonia aquimarina]|uniref:hypothetical protein n=1 Tax=Mesonia aquimarina TaxID=1504967 RepID=UPI000EF5B087|nr:hypothetical protein [Mesonia aquimarina]
MNKSSKYSRKNIAFPILMFALLLIEMKILDSLFPYPGFKAIVALPIIYGISSVIIILGVFLTKKLNLKLQIASWILIFVINTIVAVRFYPQQGRQTAIKQIVNTYNVISNYGTINKNDLELYTTNEYNAFDKNVPDDKERYITALFKFRNEIKRDGSNFLYGQKDKPILGDTNIKEQLDDGKDRLIWWILETSKNK